MSCSRDALAPSRSRFAFAYGLISLALGLSACTTVTPRAQAQTPPNGQTGVTSDSLDLNMVPAGFGSGHSAKR